MVNLKVLRPFFHCVLPSIVKRAHGPVADISECGCKRNAGTRYKTEGSNAKKKIKDNFTDPNFVFKFNNFNSQQLLPSEGTWNPMQTFKEGDPGQTRLGNINVDKPSSL